MATKKEQTEMSVEERLKTLYQLQTTLSSVDEKKALRLARKIIVMEGSNIREKEKSDGDMVKAIMKLIDVITF